MVKKQSFLKHLIVLLSVTIVVSCAVISLSYNTIYADGMVQDKLVVEGASGSWQYCYSGNDTDYVSYELGTPVDRLVGESAVKWRLSVNEYNNNKLTKIALTKTDTGDELYAVEASADAVGLKTTDWSSEMPSANSEPAIGDFIKNKSSGLKWMGNYITFSKMVFDNDGNPVTLRSHRNGSYVEIEVMGTSVNTQYSNFNRTLTLYFNGAEDGPVIPDKVQAVIGLIDAIAEPVTLASEDPINAAREAYDALSEEDQALIDAETLKKLTDAEETLANLKAISNVVSMIDAIDDPVTLDSEEKINAAQAAYEKLNDEQKTQITNYNTLLAAREKIVELKQAAADKAAKDAKDAQDKADAAQAAADKAAQDAKDAQDKADAAQAKADTDQAKADADQAVADKAAQDAKDAQAKADEAQAKADADQAKADEAAAAADKAAKDAKEAQDKAEAAQAAAEQAAKDAKEAQDKADSVQKGSDELLKAAQEALKAAESELNELHEKISAAELTVKKVKAKSKGRKFTVKWEKNKDAEGYKVEYRKVGSNKYKLLKEVSKNKVTSKKLKKKVKYQFRVTTYKTVGGKKVYGVSKETKVVKCK